MNKTPRAFVLDGTRTEVKKWNDVLLKVFEFIYEKHTKEVIVLAQNEKIRGRGNIYLSNNKEHIAFTPTEVKPGLFLEIKFNAPYIIDTSVKLLSEFNYKDFKIETSDGLIYSAIPELNEPINQNGETNYFILRTGGDYADVPKEKYAFKNRIPGCNQLRDAANNGKFVYLEGGNFYAKGELGSVTTEQKDEVIEYTLNVLNYQEISPIKNKAIQQKIDLTISQGGITKITKAQFDFIVEGILERNRQYWQIAPNAQASAWNLCIEKGIIPIYFNEYLQNLSEEVLDYNSDQFVDFCQKNNPSATKGQVGSNVELIWSFIHDVQIGDYVLANKGKSLALGWGIITSKAKIFKEGEGITFYRDVDWKDTTLNRELDPKGLGRNFFRTIYQMTKEHFESITTMTSIAENPLYTKIQKLLDYKKQIILYGPPGTGKTWVASNFLKSKNIPENRVKTIRTGKKFFWYSVISESWEGLSYFLDKQELEEDLGVDDIYGALNEIEKGDLVFIFDISKEGRLSGIASYEGKSIVESEGTSDISLKGIKPVQGPLWKIIKDDPILHNSKPVRYDTEGSHSKKPRVVPLQLHPQQELWDILFPLTQEEGMRLLELAQVSPKDLNLSTAGETTRVSLCDFVTFHPSYAYEEFIEGLRPIDRDGNIQYEIQEGIFKRSCREALNALSKNAGITQTWEDHKPLPHFSQEEIDRIQSAIGQVPCYLVIDEINRGDISRIFGELITLIESDKRLFCDNEIRCTLPYSKMEFGIPPNLYIIGTMNTADRSISLMDIALRRRFGFIELLPDYDALNAQLLNDKNVKQVVKDLRALAIQSLKMVNERLLEKYDRDHQIGHSYLMKLSHDSSLEDTRETLANIWKYEIIPLLQEYFYDSPEKLLYITNNQFFEKSGSSFLLKPEEDIITALNALTSSKQ